MVGFYIGAVYAYFMGCTNPSRENEMMETALHGLTPLELIDTAILNEDIAAEYYEHLAKDAVKAENASLALFFRDQGRRERGQYNQLAKFRVESGLGKRTFDGATVRWLSPEADQIHAWDLSQKVDLDTALRIVEEAERKAEKFYRDAEQEVDDPDLACLFHWLAEEEARHGHLALSERGRQERDGAIPLPEYADLGYGFGAGSGEGER